MEMTAAQERRLGPEPPRPSHAGAPAIRDNRPARLRFTREWQLGEPLDQGGFGKVYVATADDGTEAVAKFVPKEPGAERELLFVDLADVRNVVPVIDTGEADGCWVLVMPRAERSLRDRLTEGSLPPDAALAVLSDIATALLDLHERVVH